MNMKLKESEARGGVMTKTAKTPTVRKVLEAKVENKKTEITKALIDSEREAVKRNNCLENHENG